MSIEIIKENFSIEKMIGKGDVQSLIETEVYLNIPIEDVEKVIWVHGDIRIQNTMIIRDKILVNGTINYNILMKDKEDKLQTLEAVKDFNEEIFIKDIKEDMESRVKGKIEYIEHEIEENRIAIKTLIDLKGQVETLKELEVIEAVEDSNDLEVLKEHLKYRQSYGSDRSTISIEESFIIDMNKPPADKVLKFFVDPKEIESTVVEDRIVLSGEAIVTLICLGEGEIYPVKEAVDFNHFLEIPGALEGSRGLVDLNVEAADYEILKDENDELRRVAVSITIEADGKVYKEDSKELLIDAYSIKEKIDIEKEELVLLEEIDCLKYEEAIDLEVSIDATDILDIRKENHILEKYYENGKIHIDGILNLGIYYIDRIEDTIASRDEEVPYRIELPYDKEVEDPVFHIDEKVREIDFLINRENVGIDTTISFQISLKKEKTINAIKDIFETGEIIDKKSKPSIIVYIVQKGDILWDIAKRYNTTMEDILSSNGLPEDHKLEILDKIIIEKNVNLSL